MITIKGIQDEDFVNYKKPSMVIAFPHCTFKCEKECGKQVCQNGALAKAPNIEINENEVVQRYLHNPITKSVICAGLEPIDSFSDLIELISELRKFTDDEIVIFTGYYKDEITDKIDILKRYKNIILKVGRYIPDQKPHKDELLGVDLASDNQHAIKIS